MQDTRIVTRLVRSDAVFLFQHHDTPIRVPLGDLVGSGQTDDAGSHDRYVKVRSFGHTMIPSQRLRSTNDGLLARRADVVNST